MGFSDMIGFRPATQGEMLYKILVDQFIEDEKQLSSALKLVYDNVSIGRRTEEFADYFFGLFCFNLTARLIKAAQYIISQPELGEALYRGHMLGFLINKCEISEFRYGRAKVNLLVNLAFEAARNSGQTISRRTKELVLAENSEINCYMCGRGLLARSSVAEQLVQYEHVWPSSFGGDSTVANLLPACCYCNNEKGSLLLWQDGPIHSFILPPYPSQNDLTSISRRAKIARHRRDMFALANRDKITLKSAASRIGPYNFQNVSSADPDDAADFFTFKF